MYGTPLKVMVSIYFFEGAGIYLFKAIDRRWFFTNPFETYARRNGFIFPKVRGENSKNIWNHHVMSFTHRGTVPRLIGKVSFHIWNHHL